MDAKQCDRCGSYYTPAPMVDETTQFKLVIDAYPLEENPQRKDICFKCVKTIVKNIASGWGNS